MHFKDSMAVFFVRRKKSLFRENGRCRLICNCRMRYAQSNTCPPPSECSRRYGSDKKTKQLVGLVVTNVNIPTSTGRAIWFAQVRFHLGRGHTKLHELSVRSAKKAPTPKMEPNPNKPACSPSRSGYIDICNNQTN